MVLLIQPVFTRLLLKVFTVLDVGSIQFNSFLCLFCFSTLTFFSFSTLSCMYRSEGTDMSKLHDMLGFIIVLSNEIFLLTNQAHVSNMIEFLVEPFEKFERNHNHSKIVQGYHRQNNFYSMVFPTFTVVAIVMWSIASLVAMNITTSNRDEECYRLVFGWVWYAGSDFYFIFLNTVCMALTLFRSFLVYIAMLCAIIKIKFKLRLLCADLLAADELTNRSGEKIEAEVSTVESTSRTQSTSRHNNYQGSLAGTLQGIEEENKLLELYLQTYLKEKIKKEKVKSYLRNLVEQHVDIMEKIKLTNKYVMLPVMTYHQIAVVIFAMAVPDISLNNELLVTDYIIRGVEVFVILITVGCFNYLGQIMLDESESLRQALYSCDWTDKPPSVRQGLLIMMIVATKPLKLTISGFYTLGMETYGNVLSAAYSYTSFIQSQNT